MCLGDQCTLREDPHQKARELWDLIEGEGQPLWL
jgi:hypothetical protein